MQIETEVIVGFVMATAGGAVAWLAQRSIGELDRRISAMEKRMDDDEGDIADLRRDHGMMGATQGRMDERLTGIEKTLAEIKSDVRALLNARRAP